MAKIIVKDGQIVTQDGTQLKFEDTPISGTTAEFTSITAQNLYGNGSNLNNVVKTTGDQIISGIKTFNQIIGGNINGNSVSTTSVKVTTSSTLPATSLFVATSYANNDSPSYIYGWGGLRYKPSSDLLYGPDIAINDTSTYGHNLYVNGTAYFSGDVTAPNFIGNITGDITGNAGTATKLQTARTITATGDVSWTVNFDGSENVTATATVADYSHNHIISNIDGLQDALDNKLPTTGKAADSDKLDGLDSTSFLRSDAVDAFTTLSGINLDVSGELEGQFIGVGNNSSTSGYGISLYNGGVAGEPTYGIMFAGTPTFGIYGPVTSDWATYFTMNDAANRGWIFRRKSNAGSANVAAISNTGVAEFAGSVTASSFIGNITGNITGNADTATKLQTPRTIEATGDISWSVSFDGSGDASGTAAIGSGVIVNDDISASAAIVDTKLATIITAGKVANSATTATSAATGNAIVARDASGNFYTNQINFDTGAYTYINYNGFFQTNFSNRPLYISAAGDVSINIDNNDNDIDTKAFTINKNAFTSGGTELFRVHESGDVSIGSTTSSGYKLYVNGTAYFDGNVTTNGSFIGNITGTADKVANFLTRGSYLTGDNFDGSAATTWAVDATSSNSGGKIVARDAYGNFSAQTITAALNGNAASATGAQKIYLYNGTSASNSFYIPLTTGATGYQYQYSDTELRYLGDSNLLYVPKIAVNGTTTTFGGVEYKLYVNGSALIELDLTALNFIGNGSQITDISTTNIVDFTTNVRNQFSAGTDISITNGQISYTGSNVTIAGGSGELQYNNGANQLAATSDLKYTSSYNELKVGNMLIRKPTTSSTDTEVSLHHQTNSGVANDYILKATAGGTTSLNCKSSSSIQFRVANSTKVIVNNNGRVGIGTSIPDQLLEIYGSSPVIKLTNTAQTESGIHFVDSANETGDYAKVVYDSSSEELKLYCNSTSPAMIFSNFGKDITTATNSLLTVHTLYANTVEVDNLVLTGNIQAPIGTFSNKVITSTFESPNTSTDISIGTTTYPSTLVAQSSGNVSIGNSADLAAQNSLSSPGSLGIQQDLYVGDDAKIIGDLTVQGNAVGLLKIKQSSDTYTSGLRLIESGAQTAYWTICLQDTTVTPKLDNRFSFFYGTSEKGYMNPDANGSNINFTGQHRNISDTIPVNSVEQYLGLIVVSDGTYASMEANNITINEALPKVSLASKRNQKSVFGVVSDAEDENAETREYAIGNFVSVNEKTVEDTRLIINSLGEGGIWVTNINGNLENGDYITSCEIPGYGMKQDDDLLHNYTVAKITCDCEFDLDSPIYICEEFEWEGQTFRRAFVGCTYHCG